MKIILYATIGKKDWKEGYLKTGIKGVKKISGLYAQTRNGRNVKDAILTQAVPFWMTTNEEEVIIQFKKDPKEILVDFGDSPDAYEKGIPPEADDTYEHLDPERVKDGTTCLYCSYVKEIRPEEILQVVYSLPSGSDDGDVTCWKINGVDSDKWQKRQPVTVNE